MLDFSSPGWDQSGPGEGVRWSCEILRPTQRWTTLVCFDWSGVPRRQIEEILFKSNFGPIPLDGSYDLPGPGFESRLISIILGTFESLKILFSPFFTHNFCFDYKFTTTFYRL